MPDDFTATIDPAGRTALVIGAGFGLLVGERLLSTGQVDMVVVISLDDPRRSTLMYNAAGLVEMIGLESLPDALPGSFDPIAAMLKNIEVCNRLADDPSSGVDRRTVDFYGHSEAEVGNDGRDNALNCMPNWHQTDSDLDRYRYKASFDTFVIDPTVYMTRRIMPLFAARRMKVERRTLRDRGDVVDAARRLNASVVVITAGVGLNAFRSSNSVEAGVGVTFLLHEPPTMTDRVFMTSDLLYAIPRRLVWTLGGCMEMYDPATMPALHPENYPAELSAVRQRIVEAGWLTDDQLRRLEPRVGARPVAPHPILEVDLDEDGRRVVTLGGLGGSGWTVAAGVLDLVEHVLKV